MFQILPNKVINPDKEEIARFRQEFAEKNCVVIPGLFNRECLDMLWQRLEKAEWKQNERGSVFNELRVKHRSPVAMFASMLVNRPEVFRSIEEITDCRNLGIFGGRIYRLEDKEHFFDWHTDLGKAPLRIVGMSVNLNSPGIPCGTFQIRDSETKNITGEISNTEPGTAHLFQIRKGLEHRVSPLGDAPYRQAMAGWFHEKTEADGDLVQGLVNFPEELKRK